MGRIVICATVFGGGGEDVVYRGVGGRWRYDGAWPNEVVGGRPPLTYQKVGCRDAYGPWGRGDLPKRSGARKRAA